MSLGKKVLISSSLLIGIKIFQRLIGLISILFLARLLTPDDFAIVALTAIVVHFFDILSNAGSEQYILQKQDVNERDLNTAWSIDLTMKTLLWLLLLLSAPFAAIFFNQPELDNALYASSVILIINAAKNPGLFLKKQNFEYGQIFWLSVIQRIVTFFIAITIAYIERSFWALIIADICSSIIFTTGSYLIDKHRPKFSFQQWKKQWNFSGWLLLKSIIGYTRSQIDTLIVSKFFPQAQLGQYYMARDIAMLPSHTIILPATEPLIAAFKSSRNNPEKQESQLRLNLVAIITLSIPISFFMGFFPQPIIETLLGSQWIDSIEILSMLSLLLFYFSIVQVLEQFLVATNRVKPLFIYDLLSLIFITLTLLAITEKVEISEFALFRGVLGVLTMSALLLYIHSIINLKIKRIIFYIAFLSIISMVSVFFSMSFNIYKTTAINLIINLAIFGLSYLSFLLLITYTFRRQLYELNEFLVLISNWLRPIKGNKDE